MVVASRAFCYGFNHSCFAAGLDRGNLSCLPNMDFPTPRIRTELYPEIEPLRSGHLGLDRRHEMDWEEPGNPQWSPVEVLHGAPAAGARAMHLPFFHPLHYRATIFDQRGVVRSLSHDYVPDN